MQLVCFYVLPLLISSIHGRAVAPSTTDNSNEISAPRVATAGSSDSTNPQVATAGSTDSTIPRVASAGSTLSKNPQVVTAGSTTPQVAIAGSSGSTTPQVATAGSTDSTTPRVATASSTDPTTPQVATAGSTDSTTPQVATAGPTDSTTPQVATAGPTDSTTPQVATADATDSIISQAALTNPTDSTTSATSTDSTDSEKCIISIEVGDCDTYQTCTKSVKVSGNCPPQREQDLRPIHCSFDVPRGMAGTQDLQDVLDIRCFPSPRRHVYHPHEVYGFPEDTAFTIEELPSDAYPEEDLKNPTPPNPVSTRPTCVNTPLPKNLPQPACEEDNSLCKLETWYYVPPNCVADAKVPEKCSPIPKSTCDQAADNCISPSVPEANSDKCIPEIWYYTPPNCVPDAKAPAKCLPVPKSACDQAPSKCDPFPYNAGTPNMPYPPHRGDMSFPVPPGNPPAEKLPKYPRSSDDARFTNRGWRV